MGAPEVLMIVWLTLGAMGPVLKHGQPRDPHDGGLSLVGTAIVALLLWWGGFWA